MKSPVLAALVLAIFFVGGCGARQPSGRSLASYSHVVIEGEQMPDHLQRLRVGLARTGLDVIDQAGAAAAPKTTLRCNADIREEAVRSIAHLTLLDYETREVVWEGRYSRKWANTVPRVIDAATDELRADYAAARATAAR